MTKNKDTKQVDELPKMRKCFEKLKVTLYFDADVVEIYRAGKINGWDVSEIVRRAATNALREKEPILLTKAE